MRRQPQSQIVFLCFSLLLAGCGRLGPTGDPSPTSTFPVPGRASPPPADGATSSPPGSPEAPPREGPPRLTQIGVFDQPTGVFSPPSDPRLFVVEKAGTIQVLAPGGEKKTVLDIKRSVSSGGERGLLSIAFPPDYAESGLAYIYYTDTQGDSRVVEYKVDGADPDRLDPGSRRELLFVEQPYSNHNGGLLLFDPSGMLMIGLGDGGSSGDPGNRAQDLGELLGKLLRIDPRRPGGGKPYGIPEDNPFVGRGGARPEIWAYGLRNPWRYSFHPPTGDLFVADVGQNRFEEINFVPPAAQPGANYGWRKYEGNEVFKDQRIDESKLVRPVHTYRLGRSTCSVAGGHVYRGSVAALRDFYLYADFCGSNINGFKIAGGSATDRRTFDELEVSSVVAFGEDSRNETYVVSLDGPVYQIS